MNNEIFSQVLGYISIACWVVVSIPQLYENYKRKSSESVSVTFLILWLLGDTLNLMGSILQNLISTVILLAVYYIISDIVIIAQVLYYHNYKRPDEIVITSADESIPLLRTQQNYTSSPPSFFSRHKQFFGILGGIICVFLTGIVSYCISSISLEFKNNDDMIFEKQRMKFLPQILGWLCAVLYLGSRIPQIIKNHKSKSTEGLSLAMFCFSVLGNITFCSSILFHSTEHEYLLINLPWLCGNGGTLFFDFV
ncbi:7316_t:CDS:2 [Diversispora eburnea]|uniref:7316_t:CDS:1 n=1 Tax=Diversispora eburnea TaxID=1213867 RepID=A0A9N9A2Y0_9GLOM|nr:7316_t:CDS:2 [Diversispora eburnea]